MKYLAIILLLSGCAAPKKKIEVSTPCSISINDPDGFACRFEVKPKIEWEL